MKTRLFTLLLALIMVAMRPACGAKQPPAETTGDTTPPAPTNTNEPVKTTLTILEDAGNKLKNAASFAVTVMDTKVEGEAVTEQLSTSILCTLDADGTRTVMKISDTKDNEEGAVQQFYLKNNVGYSCDTWSNPISYYKYISDQSFADKALVQWIGNIYVSNSNMFEEFCKLNPTASVDANSTTTYVAGSLTLEQARTVIPGVFGHLKDPAEYKDAYCAIDFSVDAEGCLTSQTVSIQNVVSGGKTLGATYSISYEGVGERLVIQEPKWAANFAQLKSPKVYDLFADGFLAVYEKSKSGGKDVFLFKGVQSADGSESKNAPAYTMKTELEGLPVQAAKK